MKSALIVISWWSNCLGLRCLHDLARWAPGRQLYVVQVGKSAAQEARFRRYLPAGVTEIDYPADRPAEHGKVVEALVREYLATEDGLWFFDHDAFFGEPLAPWLAAMDRRFDASGCCLGHLAGGDSPAITCPAFWFSPARLPAGTPGLVSIPYEPMPASRRPDLYCFGAELRLPEKDTLVLARDYLAARDLTCRFTLESLPRHRHLGGLYLLAIEALPANLDDWAAGCVERFTDFYAACPREWLEIEDPGLLGRLGALRQVLSSRGAMAHEPV
ncbi:MAG: hypothetical protein PVF47_20660 [Anaerolineae bacterium]|jgi:hypothetical protein